MTTKLGQVRSWNTCIVVIITLLVVCCVSVSPLLAQNAVTLEQANQALEEGRFKEAIAAYKELLDADPENFSTRAHLARSYYLASNMDPDYFYSAVQEYNALIRNIPDFSLPYLELGQISYLLGLEALTKGNDNHANGLFESALDWYQKYAQLEATKTSWDSQREVIATLVLEAVANVRLAQEQEAARLLRVAQDNYDALALENPEYSALYDYLTISAVEYLSDDLYNQAIIYIEAAWLLQPRPQLESLFQAAMKAKKMSLSLPSFSTREPLQRQTLPLTTAETIQLLQEQVLAISSQLDSVGMLEQQVASCQSGLRNMAQLQTSIDKLETRLGEILLRLDNIQAPVLSASPVTTEPGTGASAMLHELTLRVATLESNQRELLAQSTDSVGLQLRDELKSVQTLPGQLRDLKERTATLEQEIELLTETTEHLRTIADMYNVLALQLQDIKAAIGEIEAR